MAAARLAGEPEVFVVHDRRFRKLEMEARDFAAGECELRARSEHAERVVE
jgi:hypothetical protein